MQLGARKDITEVGVQVLKPSITWFAVVRSVWRDIVGKGRYDVGALGKGFLVMVGFSF